MIAQNLIRNNISPLAPSDSLFFALEMMNDYKLQHLPLFDRGVYLGLVAEDDLLDAADDQLSIKAARIPTHSAQITAHNHLFDAIAVFGEQNVSMLPVLDEHENYLGYIYPNDIVAEMGNMLSSKIPGGILVLLINQNNYYLSQIAQIVEANDGKILASYLSSHANSTQLEVTLRINRTDLTPIIQTLLRYDYTVSATFHESLHTADLKDRYDNFMKYLNM